MTGIVIPAQEATMMQDIVNCHVQITKCRALSKTCSENCEQLEIRAVYNFVRQEVTLQFNRENLCIRSLNVFYDFAKYKVPKNKIICSLHSSHYQVSIAEVPRHVFYQKFSCNLIYKWKSDANSVNFRLDVPHLQTASKVKLKTFQKYSIPRMLKTYFESFQEGMIDEEHLMQYIRTSNRSRIDQLHNALYIEELDGQHKLLPYTLRNIYIEEINYDGDRFATYRFKVNKAALPEKILETSIHIAPTSNDQKRYVNNMIKKTTQDCLEFSRFKYKAGNLDRETSYTIYFVPNDISFKACHNALKVIQDKKLENYFDNFETYYVPRRHQGSNHVCFGDASFVWFNENIASNSEQKTAIKNIVNCTSNSLPYCIFGPPGTGKTSCLVECILQIMKLKPESKILVSAQSNSACNEIGERLLQYTSINKIFRFYSSRLHATNPNALSQKLLPSSNLRGLKPTEESIFPTKEELKHFSIVISTLITSSQLDRASLQNHFDYIFIDECAATNEPEACIPIVGLGFDKNEVYASVILIGDPKQLPPVISSPIASKMGLSVSLMERVMTKAYYRSYPSYNTKFITQLLDNYRSHPAILHFSNVEFYGSKLRATNSSDEILLGTKWCELPNLGFPVGFHYEKCPSQKDGTSSYNAGEIKVVKKYVDKLLQHGIGGTKIKFEDIGVVTPYKAQSEKLRKVLNSRIEIGTSEYYQGREKLIIIISTVKSKTSVGFLSDERRLNVCLTRAKALMIVVGNAETLQTNALWGRFVDYCVNNNAIMGEKIIKKESLRPQINPEVYNHYTEVPESPDWNIISTSSAPTVSHNRYGSQLQNQVVHYQDELSPDILSLLGNAAVWIIQKVMNLIVNAILRLF